jgi:protein-tyrosine phosphatase
VPGRRPDASPGGGEPGGSRAAAPYAVCFVCTGNICRSPMAEVVLRSLMDDAGLGSAVAVSSAGTGNWHEGEPMDPRAAAALRERGYDGRAHRARPFEARWFDDLDLVVALDRRHRQTLRGLGDRRGFDTESRLVLLRAFDAAASGAVDIPDPYYGDDQEFSRCLDLVEAGCRGLAGPLATALRP